MNNTLKPILWILLLTGLVYFISLIKDALLPFVISLVISYLLNPIVTKLTGKYLPRALSAALVSLIFFALIFILLFTLVPILYNQLTEFVAKLPAYNQFIEERLLPFIDKISLKVDKIQPNKIQDFTKNFSGSLIEYISKILKRIWQSGLAFFNIISIIVLTPIITFYLLKDFPLIGQKLLGILPANYTDKFKNLFLDISNTLSSYLRGQVNVCLIMSIYYMTALKIINLDFAIFIGVTTGILTFIPFIGVGFGAFTALLVSYLEFPDDKITLLKILTIFIVGNLIESNFITPKLVGEKIGLHPVILIFSMICGGVLFGFVGIIFAIPVTAVLKVILKFIIVSARETGVL